MRDRCWEKMQTKKENFILYSNKKSIKWLFKDIICGNKILLAMWKKIHCNDYLRTVHKVSGNLTGNDFIKDFNPCFWDALLMLDLGNVNTRISGFKPLFIAISIASCIPVI